MAVWNSDKVTAMSYEVLKAWQALNKAKSLTAWVEQVINHSSSSPAVPPVISLLVKKMLEMELVFKPRKKNIGVPSSEET